MDQSMEEIESEFNDVIDTVEDLEEEIRNFESEFDIIDNKDYNITKGKSLRVSPRSMNDHESDVMPGPNEDNEFYVDIIYSMEYVDEVLHFAVQWKGYKAPKYNTLEPFDNVKECIKYDEFIKRFMRVGTGSMSGTKTTAKRSIMRPSLRSNPTEQMLYDQSSKDNFFHGNNIFEETANKILVKFATEGKFSRYMSFFSKSGEELKFESHFYKQLMEKFAILESGYELSPLVIGHPFETKAVFNEMTRTHPQDFAELYSQSSDSLVKKFRQILNKGKGILAFVVKRLEPHRMERGGRIHCRVLVVTRERRVIYFDPYKTADSYGREVREVSKKLGKSIKVELHPGLESKGMLCLQRSVQFICDIMSTQLQF